MDQGINLPFDSTGVDDPTYGLPVFADGLKGLVITGSSQRAINENKGGRLLLNVKCVHDPAGVDNGKDHLISLNIWHSDEETAERAKKDLASLIRAIFGTDRRMNNTAELYNQPFMAKAVTQTSQPTQKYPNPTPQTQWRGFFDRNGNEVKSGIANGGNNAGPGAMPNFNQNGQPQQQGNNGFAQQQPQQGNGNGGWGNGGNAGNPNGNGAPQGQNGNNQPQFNQPPQNSQPDQNGWGNNAQPGANAQPPNTASQNGGWGGNNGGNAPSPSNGQPQQQNNNWGNNGGNNAPAQQPQQQNNGWGNNGNGNGNQGGWG